MRSHEKLVLASCLIVVALAAAPAFGVPALTVTKKVWTLDLAGTGWNGAHDVKIFVVRTGGDVQLGTIFAVQIIGGTFINPLKGAAPMQWPNQFSGAAAVKPLEVIKAVENTTNATVTAVAGVPTGVASGLWRLAKSVAYQEATNTFGGTGLDDGDFSGTVECVAVSSNISVTNTPTAGYDVLTDTVEASADYDTLLSGIATGTFEASGTFPDLVDPDTGSGLGATMLTLSEDVEIGIVLGPVPIAGPAALGLLAAAVGIVGASSLRGRASRGT